MKTLALVRSVAIGFILMSVACKKDKQQLPVSELAKLPPATQTGANTFGCLVNGKAFLPNYINLYQGTGIQCYYMYINKGFYLTAGGSHKNSDGSINSVILYADSLAEPLYQGDTLNLTGSGTHNKSFGVYNLIDPPYNSKSYSTDETVTGRLIITRLDQINLIISGTFSFDSGDQNGNKISVTNGLFDMKY